MTTIHFPHWWSTHTKYGSYDHNTLPLLVVYTHQIWKLRPQHPSFTGGLHTPNMEVTTTLPPLVVYTHQIWKLRPHLPHWWSTHTKYERYDHTSPTGGLHTPNMEEGMTNNDTHYIPFTWYVTHTLPLQAYCDYTLAD